MPTERLNLLVPSSKQSTIERGGVVIASGGERYDGCPTGGERLEVQLSGGPDLRPIASRMYAHRLACSFTHRTAIGNRKNEGGVFPAAKHFRLQVVDTPRIKNTVDLAYLNEHRSRYANYILKRRWLRIVDISKS